MNKILNIIILSFIFIIPSLAQKGFIDISDRDLVAPNPFNKDIITAYTHDQISSYTQVALDTSIVVIRTKGFYEANDGGGAEYVIKRDTGNFTVDGINVIQVQSNPNRYAIRIASNVMDLRSFGVRYGIGVDSSIARTNFFRLRSAANFQKIVGGELFAPKGEIEVWIEANENCITLSNDDSFILKGAGLDQTIIHTVPDARHRMAGSADLIDAIFQGTIDIDGITFEGKTYELDFQTYHAILRADANARKIKLTDTLAIYSDFFNTVSPGDTMLITDDWNGPSDNYTSVGSGYFVIDSISSIDSTIYTTTDISVTNDYIDPDTRVAFTFLSSTPNDTIDVYGKAWSTQATSGGAPSLGGITMTDTESQLNSAILVDSGASDYTDRSEIKINNVRIHSFGVGVSVIADKAPIITGYNVIFSGAHSLAMGYFPQAPPPPEYLVSMHFNMFEMYDSGTFLDGGQAGGDGDNTAGVYGSGFYTHPNYGARIENFRIHNNLASSFRQYSASGISAPDYPEDYHFTVFENGVFHDNTEYNVFTSAVIRTVFRNVRFQNGPVALHHSTIFENCEFQGSSPTVQNDGGNDADYPPEYGGGFIFSFDNCTFSDSSQVNYSSAWDKQQFSRITSIELSNIVKEIGLNGYPLISIAEGSDSINQPMKVLLDNVKLRLSDTLNPQSNFSNPFNGDDIPKLVEFTLSQPNGYVDLILKNISTNRSGELFGTEVLGLLNEDNSRLSVYAESCDFSNWQEFQRGGNIRTRMRNVILPGNLRNQEDVNLINTWDKHTAKAHYTVSDITQNHTRDLNILNGYQVRSNARPIGFSSDYTFNNLLPISYKYTNYSVTVDAINEVTYIGNTDNLGGVNANSSYHRSINNTVLGSVELNVNFSNPVKIIPNSINSESNILGSDTIYVDNNVTLKYHPAMVYPVDGTVNLVDTTILIAVGDGLVSAFDGEIQQFLVPGSAMLETGVVTGTVVAPDENGVIYKGGVVQGLIDDSPYLTYRFEFDTAPAVGDSVFITCQMYNTTGSNVHRGMWEVDITDEQVSAIVDSLKWVFVSPAPGDTVQLSYNTFILPSGAGTIYLDDSNISSDAYVKVSSNGTITLSKVGAVGSQFQEYESTVANPTVTGSGITKSYVYLYNSGIYWLTDYQNVSPLSGVTASTTRVVKLNDLISIDSDATASVTTVALDATSMPIGGKFEINIRDAEVYNCVLNADGNQLEFNGRQLTGDTIRFAGSSTYVLDCTHFGSGNIGCYNKTDYTSNTGFEFVSDTTYTRGGAVADSLHVPAGDTITLQLQNWVRGDTIHLPLAVNTFFVDSTIIVDEDGGGYQFRLNFEAYSSTANTYIEVLFEAPTLSGAPNIIDRTQTLPKGTNQWVNENISVNVFGGTIVGEPLKIRLTSPNAFAIAAADLLVDKFRAAHGIHLTYAP